MPFQNIKALLLPRVRCISLRACFLLESNELQPFSKGITRLHCCAVHGGDLTLTGGSERTVFKFQVEVERLITTLLYEEENSKPLALAQIDDVRFNLSVHPDTLHLTTALGNLKAQDGQLPEVHSLALNASKTLQSWLVRSCPSGTVSPECSCNSLSESMILLSEW